MSIPGTVPSHLVENNLADRHLIETALYQTNIVLARCLSNSRQLDSLSTKSQSAKPLLIKRRGSERTQKMEETGR
jgi:hypothetical protein